jgi:hypothetical protein
MFRMLALGGAVAVGSILPGSAPAQADPLCQYVVLAGTVPDTASGCLPYGGPPACNTLHAGPSKFEEVYVTVCVPSVG